MENQTIVAVIILVIVLFSLSGCTQEKQPNENPMKILYVGSIDSDYQTIQEALNASVNGTTIIIRNGRYNELLIINKTVYLRGENKDATIIDFNPNPEVTQVAIITINADGCSLENFSITLSKHSIIVDGLSILSNNNTIQNINIIDVINGIKLHSSSSNKIMYNEIRNNLIGLEGVNSGDNIISNNIFSNTQYDIYLTTNCNYNNISFNVINHSDYGVRIKASQKNNVYSNCIVNNNVGVYCCCSAQSNYIYHNYFVNNSENGKENAGLINVWYDPVTNTGNYWDDYNGSDMNQDNIGDISYEISDAGNQDLYPLMTTSLDIACKP